MHTLMSLLNVSSCLAAACLVLTASSAQAQLAHRYSFDSDISDSVGTAHGTVVDAGTTANFAFAGGQLDLSANNGNGSNAITEDAYVDLPNGTISAAFSGGTSGAATFETWATVATARTWQRIFDFGNSNDGEDTSNSGSNTVQIYLSPNNNRFGNGPALTNEGPTDPGASEAGTTNQLTVGTQYHFAGVYDHNNTTSGANGTMSFYIDGALIGAAPIQPALNLNTLDDVNNWLGRSQWGDPIFDGSFNEFRIYDEAASSNYIRRSFQAGPDALVDFAPQFDLTMKVNTTNGATLIENTADIPITFSYYIAESAGGSLNTTGWNSLSDQGLSSGPPEDVDGSGTVGAGDITTWQAAYATNANGDTDGDGDSDGADFLAIQRAFGSSGGPEFEWSEAGGSSANSLAELNLNGSITLAPGATVSLGNMFSTGSAQDLEFRYAEPGSPVLFDGAVEYVTSLSALAAVPEPSTIICLLMASATIACGRRRIA